VDPSLGPPHRQRLAGRRNSSAKGRAAPATAGRGQTSRREIRRGNRSCICRRTRRARAKALPAPCPPSCRHPSRRREAAAPLAITAKPLRGDEAGWWARRKGAFAHPTASSCSRAGCHSPSRAVTRCASMIGRAPAELADNNNGADCHA
jgi:hypothetical protein